MPSSGPQVNNFPSFQTLTVIRHADSSAKFVCASQQRRTGRCEAQSREPVNKVKPPVPMYACIKNKAFLQEGA
jgi:hypothetical protein